MSRSSVPPSALQEFQAQYSAHLRDPAQRHRPKGVPERRSQVYQTLLFNNVCGLINPCFPVARQMIAQEQWRHLCRAFYSQWLCTTPYFSRIPHEMVQFVQQHQAELALPEWLAELIHYEWIELQVETHPGQVAECQSLLSEPHRLHLNPTLVNLSYRWPVHKIAPGHEPKAPEPTCLLVYRNQLDQVNFIEANPLTATLITLIERQPGSAQQMLDALAALAPQISYPALVQFGMPLIEDLAQRGVLAICGTESG